MRPRIGQAMPADAAPSLIHNLPLPPQFRRHRPPHGPLLLPARPIQHPPRPQAFRNPQNLSQPPPPPLHHHSRHPPSGYTSLPRYTTAPSLSTLFLPTRRFPNPLQPPNI